MVKNYVDIPSTVRKEIPCQTCSGVTKQSCKDEARRSISLCLLSHVEIKERHVNRKLAKAPLVSIREQTLSRCKVKRET